jgi:hypothetical protein
MTTPFSEKLRFLRPYAIGGLVSVVGFVLIVLGAYTITHSEEKEERNLHEPTGQRVIGEYGTIIMVEGCEYITRIDSQSGTVYYGMAHRGLCRNLAHDSTASAKQ